MTPMCQPGGQAGSYMLMRSSASTELDFLFSICLRDNGLLKHIPGGSDYRQDSLPPPKL